MLSLGTEVFLAFWIASYRVGLPAGSPPPARAATSMFLISLANSMPRRASMTAFLCLVVAHLEWPDMRCCLYFRCRVSRTCRTKSTPGPVDHFHEQLVHPVVACDLGVERSGQQVRLPDGDDPTDCLTRGDPGDDLDVLPHLLHPRRSDEHRVEPLVEVAHVQIGLERVHLAAEGFAADHDVEPADGLLSSDARLDVVGEHDHPGTGAECRQPGPDRVAQGVEHVEGAGELVHRGRLTTGDHDPVDLRDLPRPSYGDGVGTRTRQHREMLAHVALQGEHADRGSVVHAPIVGACLIGTLPTSSRPCLIASVRNGFQLRYSSR